jgi:hypothetical protein
MHPHIIAPFEARRRIKGEGARTSITVWGVKHIAALARYYYHH